MMKALISVAALLSVVNSAQADGWFRSDAPSVLVEHDGRYIYYRYSWTQMSAEDQKDIVDASSSLIKDDLQNNLSKKTGTKSLANYMLASDRLDQLTAQAQKAVQIADTKSYRGLFPVAFMVFGGGGGGIGLGSHFGLSGDLGFVVFPQKVVRVDSETGASDSYIKLDRATVIVPHGHFGIGAGGGAAGTVGVSLIWGDMTKAADFSGVILNAGVNVKYFAGGDLTVAAVRNVHIGKNFFIAAISADFGAEVNASADIEGGYVFTLGEAATYISKKIPAFNSGDPKPDSK